MKAAYSIGILAFFTMAASGSAWASQSLDSLGSGVSPAAIVLGAGSETNGKPGAVAGNSNEETVVAGFFSSRTMGIVNGRSYDSADTRKKAARQNPSAANGPKMKKKLKLRWATGVYR